MEHELKPIKAESLKELFIQRFEDLILSGTFPIGEKLPPERELALKLGVSRPVVHEGLVDLAHKGLVTMKPRIGTIVNDYRKTGSLPILNSLVKFENNNLEPKMLHSLLELRIHFEVENARLAALRRDDENLKELKKIIKKEKTINKNNTSGLTEVDFSFHLNVALSTGNMVYPMLINSFKGVYTNFTNTFFKDPNIVSLVFGFHDDLVVAIEAQDSDESANIMNKLLTHGEKNLLNQFNL